MLLQKQKQKPPLTHSHTVTLSLIAHDATAAIVHGSPSSQSVCNVKYNTQNFNDEFKNNRFKQNTTELFCSHVLHRCFGLLLDPLLLLHVLNCGWLR